MAKPDKTKSRVSAMEAIVWLLRCYKCRAEFEVKRLPTAEVIAAALESECPHCSAKPPVFRLGKGANHIQPHDIVGLREK